ncbi:MAG: formate dehydrogenase, partial [Chloroflexota bacterium]|nr:formate dehydrogenase [Chloroflexota bacterium]
MAKREAGAKAEYPHLERAKKRWDPRHWASWKPFGIGEQHPNNFAEIVRAVRENSDQPGYAYRIISRGVCDGCALGVAGFHDWTMPSVHLC